jgi:uncharacterized protein CbrC (UPF0167 family)
VGNEPAAAGVDASSASLVEAARVTPREVINRLKIELELAREFFSQNKSKSAPRPIPTGSVTNAVVSKDACLEATSVDVDTIPDYVQDSLIADSSHAAYEPAAAVVDASSLAQKAEARVPPREVIDRLKTELELAREFSSLSTIKAAPRPIPPGSVSSAVVSKDAGLKATSVGTTSDAVQASVIADSSSVGNEPAAAAVDVSSASLVEAARVTPREVIDRLKIELELAREFFSQNKIKSAPRPIPTGSVTNAVVSKDACLEATSVVVDTMPDSVQDSLIADSSHLAYEPAAAAVDASSVAQKEEACVPPREVIDRLKTELELARGFFSFSTIKSAPRLIPPGSVSSAVVSNNAGLQATSVDTKSDAVQGSVIAYSSSVGYEPAAATVDVSSASLVEAACVTPREVIDRLKTELELAREFFYRNKIKSAPRPIPTGSFSNAVVSKDAVLEAASLDVDTIPDSVQDSLIADSSPLGYELAAATVDASSASLVEAACVPQREAIERLKTELELAREFFSLNTIKPAPRPIPPGSVSNDAGLKATSFVTMSDAVQGSVVADSSSVVYEPAGAAVDASSSSFVETARVTPREVIDRLKTELELARKFFFQNKIKSAPHPIPPGSVSDAVVSKDAGLEATSVEVDTIPDSLQDSLIADSSPLVYELAAAAVDASSASLVEAARVPPREAIERLKTELELASEFFSLNTIKPSPRPIPSGSVSSAVVSKDAGLKVISVDTTSDAVQGSVIAHSSSVGYEPAAVAVGASSASLVETARVTPREVFDRLKTELELAREFFSQNKSKSAPRPIPPGSVSSAVVSKDAGLKATSVDVDTMPDSVQDSVIADSSPGAYEPAAAAVDASRASLGDSARVPMREVIERLKTELELAREFFSLETIKTAPRPIPSGSISSAVVSKDAGLEAASVDTISDAVQDSMIADTFPVGYESAAAAVDASSVSLVKAARVPPREVIDRLKTELELAREFSSLGTIKTAPSPILPGSVSRGAGLDELPLAKPALAFDPHDENISSPESSSVDTLSVGLATADARPATTMDASSASKVKASRVDVIERLKRELDLARYFIAQNEIKCAPRLIPPASISSAFVSKDVGLDEKPSAQPASAFGPHDENISSPESSSVDTMSVGSTTADARPDTTMDASSASQVKASRFEVMERLKRELDLARDFISQNEIKRAPRLIPPASISSAFVSKDVGLDEKTSAKPASAFRPHDENIYSPGSSSVDTLSVGSTTADASPAATIDESITSQMKASHVPPIEVMERLKHALDLTLESFSYNTIKPASRPIPPGSLSNIVVSNCSDSSAFVRRDVDLDATPLVKPAPAFNLNHVSSPAPGGSYMDTMSDVAQGSTIVVAPADSLIASHSHVKASRAPPREVMKRLRHELDLAVEFSSRNVIKPAPRPIPPDSVTNTVLSNGSDSSASISKDVHAGATPPVKPAPAFFSNDASSPVPASSSGASSPSQVKAARVLPREVIDRLMRELELAREFFSHNRIKPAPSPMPRQ